MNNETGHSIICKWPYADCESGCPYLAEWDSRKFSAPLAERLWTLTLDSTQDDDLGESDGFGWFALFKSERAMLSVDSQGFVGVALYETAEDMHAAWAEVGRQYAWSVLDALDTTCGGLFLIIDTARHAGSVPDMEEVWEHVRSHPECREANAWVLEDL